MGYLFPPPLVYGCLLAWLICVRFMALSQLLKVYSALRDKEMIVVSDPG